MQLGQGSQSARIQPEIHARSLTSECRETGLAARLLIAWPSRRNTSTGEHQHYAQRMKWWRIDSPEPDNWMTLTDQSGGRLPAADYGVALVAHRCQVEFGQVRVLQIHAAASTPSVSDPPDRRATSVSATRH